MMMSKMYYQLYLHDDESPNEMQIDQELIYLNVVLSPVVLRDASLLGTNPGSCVLTSDPQILLFIIFVWL